MTAMDCTRCEPVLLDLCYGELPPAQEVEVRTHIADCPTCRKALSRLEAGQALARHLADEAPPPELTDRILRAARAHVRRSASPLERLQGLIEAMARLAMTRHFAMATLSVLIVVVGLWSVPELTRRREARPDTLVVEATPTGEAGPSREVAQASAPPAPAAAPEPVATAQKSVRVARNDPRRKTDEGANKRAERARAYPASSGPVADRKARPQPKAAEAQGRFAQAPAEQDVAMANKAKGAAEPQGRSRPAIDDDMLSGLLDAPLSRQVANTQRKERKAEVAVPTGAAFEEREAPPPQAAPAAAAAPAAQAAPAAPAGLEDVFEAGVERYRAEDYTAAAQLFARMLESNAPSGQRASALLYLARSERALGRCDRAIRAYETLVRSYGSAQQSASALPEGVACYDQLGDSAGAIRLLEHATSVPSLSALASKSLQDRRAGKPSAEGASAPAKPTDAASGARKQ